MPRAWLRHDSAADFAAGIGAYGVTVVPRRGSSAADHGAPRAKARRGQGKRLLSYTTFNGNCWQRAKEFLEHEATVRVAQQQLPIVCGRERGLDGNWMGECSASQQSKGWKVAGASCVATQGEVREGRSAGVFVAVPRPVSLRLAMGQVGWDVSPACSPGRACMALMQVKGSAWLLVFSLYLWTGQPLSSPGNAAILDVVVQWVTKL